MTRRTRVVVAVVTMVVAIVGTAWALGPVVLRYQWEAGEEVTWDVNIEMEGLIVVEDLKVDPPGRQNLEMTVSTATTQFQTIEEVDEDGAATTLISTGPISVTTDTGMGPAQNILMDPQTGMMTVNGEEMPMPEASRTAVARIVRRVLSPRGELLESDASWDASSQMTGGVIAPQQLFSVFQSTPMVFPEGEVGEGYCWAQSADLSMFDNALPEETDLTLPPVSYVTSYKIAGFEDLDGVECVLIEFIGAADVEGVIETPMTGEDNEAVNRFGPAHFSISGTMWFDHAAGCMVREDARVVMSLVQEIEGRMKQGEEIGDVHTRIGFETLDMTSTSERIDEG